MQAIPTTLSRYGLSQIINHLLGLDPSRPFDFIIQEDLLRQDLHTHLRKHALSTEAVIVVEYLPAVLPPQVKHHATQEDWISAIAPLPWGVVATGSYDGVVRFWRDGEEVESGRFTAHGGPIKGAASLHSTNLMVTVSHDGTGCVWHVRPDGTQEEANGSPIVPVALLKDHATPLECCACGPSGMPRCVTAGWDGQLRIWELDGVVDSLPEDLHEVLKKRKTTRQKKVSTSTADIKGQLTRLDPLVPLAVLAHAPPSSQELIGPGPPPPSPHHCVTCVSWASPDIIISGSWDHSIKVWDPSISVCVETLNHSKPVMCLATCPTGEPGTLVAFGGSERALRLWDRRQSHPDTLGLGALSPSAHEGWISALAWHPTSSHHLLSASHDGSIKLWDLRTAVPLHQISSEPSDNAEMTKLLCCSWIGNNEFAWGGTDKILHTASVEVSLQ